MTAIPEPPLVAVEPAGSRNLGWNSETAAAALVIGAVLYLAGVRKTFASVLRRMV